jgi:hypothetical protein
MRTAVQGDIYEGRAIVFQSDTPKADPGFLARAFQARALRGGRLVQDFGYGPHSD